MALLQYFKLKGKQNRYFRYENTSDKYLQKIWCGTIWGCSTIKDKPLRIVPQCRTIRGCATNWVNTVALNWGQTTIPSLFMDSGRGQLSAVFICSMSWDFLLIQLVSRVKLYFLLTGTLLMLLTTGVMNQPWGNVMLHSYVHHKRQELKLPPDNLQCWSLMF